MPRQLTLASVCALLVWFGACPKRQEPRSIVVYVPAPPPAAAAPTSGEPKVLVIEEPAPPAEAEESPPPENPEPAKNAGGGRRSGSHAARTTTPPEPDETPTQENPEAPPAEVPALEPRQSSAQENELRRQYLNLEQDIRQRLARLNGARLSANDQRTLEDARMFFSQAEDAMTSGDLSRALNLARKASLLLSALE